MNPATIAQLLMMPQQQQPSAQLRRTAGLLRGGRPFWQKAEYADHTDRTPGGFPVPRGVRAGNPSYLADNDGVFFTDDNAVFFQDRI